ncbi:hypothetical protein Cgig2_023599 [Carnegiea gigantea]|uniref:Uncharacterized protein n=1 Tax=Carnegiea gigantea TaxID=171969 RepID=A0A9Q1KDL4_9CARY|nr:hypothetical protein Cgig2_023599 [Carnegiea gigantea]
MEDSTDFVSVGIDPISIDSKGYYVETGTGLVSVAIYGDPDKPALVTYPDLALNYESCFKGLFMCPEALSLLLHNFCIYHISPPGHELGAAPISYDGPSPSVDDLADQILEWLDQQESANVMQFLEAINRRPDITEELKKLQCRSLIVVGEDSSFHAEALHMAMKLDRRFSALVEVQSCGSLVTEEQPHAMLVPLEYFLMGFGIYRQPQMTVSPRSPLNPCCISPELLSPESMGLKLKPIKTRISLEV